MILNVNKSICIHSCFFLPIISDKSHWTRYSVKLKTPRQRELQIGIPKNSHDRFISTFSVIWLSQSHRQNDTLGKIYPGLLITMKKRDQTSQKSSTAWEQLKSVIFVIISFYLWQVLANSWHFYRPKFRTECINSFASTINKWHKAQVASISCQTTGPFTRLHK